MNNSKNKFTKGPWERLVHQTPKDIYISDRATNDVARIPKDAPNAMANARLIAAAPELLEALEALAKRVSETMPDKSFDVELNGLTWKAFDLINKARGES